MAGLWQLSLTQRVDSNGLPYPGAKAFFYEAETSDPIPVYAEYSLATPLTNPVIADGNGMFPPVYLDDSVSSFYRMRITDADGVTLTDMTTLPILGVGGGGGGGDPPEPVEATSVFQTGDVKIRYDTSQITGWRICNGQTVGSATSGASYANDNAQALFEFLWNKDAELVVVGGRGVSAAADWAANKRLTLPDYRGYALVGRDAMGNSAANRVPALVDLSDRTGAATITLTEAKIPAHTHVVTETPAGGHGHRVYGGNGFSNEVVGIGFSDAGGVGALNGVTVNNQYRTNLANGSTKIIEEVGNHDHDVSLANTGGDEAHDNVQPSAGITVYIKL